MPIHNKGGHKTRLYTFGHQQSGHKAPLLFYLRKRHTHVPQKYATGSALLLWSGLSAKIPGMKRKYSQFDDYDWPGGLFSRDADFFSTASSDTEPASKNATPGDNEPHSSATNDSGDLLSGSKHLSDSEPKSCSTPLAQEKGSSKNTKSQEAANKSTYKGGDDIFSVSQLVRMVKVAINANMPSKVTIRAEISNFKHHSSGHFYLTLKDDNAQISAVMWRSDVKRVKFSPEDGMEVVATGRVDVYEGQAKVQFYISKLEPAGTGALELAFRQLAEKLEKEGLFAAKHKKPLPKYPFTIAIVTSPTGAAIRDIERTLNRRFPVARKLLYPVTVQGDNAAGEIAAAIRDIDCRARQLGGVDVMIVGRGGGSIEDLWAFNEEIVARAVYDCHIPVISGVGHEIDTTIIDMVADRRAATPTAAAELAVPVLTDILQGLVNCEYKLRSGVNDLLGQRRRDIDNLANRPVFVRPYENIYNKQQQLDEKHIQIEHYLRERLRIGNRNLERHLALLGKIEPHFMLVRAGNELNAKKYIMQRAIDRRIKKIQTKIGSLTAHLLAGTPSGRINNQQQVVNRVRRRFDIAERQYIKQISWEVENYLKRLRNLDPCAVLKRGYSITRLKQNNTIIDVNSNVERGTAIITELADKVKLESIVTKSGISKKTK